MKNNDWNFEDGFVEIEDEEFYVREGHTSGFTLEEARAINKIRLSTKHGIHMSTEGALEMVRRSIKALGLVDARRS